MDIARELAIAELDVVVGRPVGRQEPGIPVVVKASGSTAPAHEQINDKWMEVATAFIERSGRVWLLGHGPRGDETEALVIQAGKEPTKAQAEVTEVVVAILEAAYADPEEETE